MLQQGGVHFLDCANRERTSAFNQLEHAFDDRLVRLNNPSHLLRVFVCGVARNQACVNSPVKNLATVQR